jgi:hypothetical protein
MTALALVVALLVVVGVALAVRRRRARVAVPAVVAIAAVEDDEDIIAAHRQLLTRVLAQIEKVREASRDRRLRRDLAAIARQTVKRLQAVDGSS